MACIYLLNSHGGPQSLDLVITTYGWAKQKSRKLSGQKEITQTLGPKKITLPLGQYQGNLNLSGQPKLITAI